MWEEDRLKSALFALERGVSQRAAVDRYGVPRQTRRNHITSGSTEKNLGRSTILSAAVEEELKAGIKRFSDIGLPSTKKVIQSYVYSYVTSNGVDHPFTNRRAGRKWFTEFMKRHPDLSVRKAQSMNPARAAKLNRFIITDYFTKLETTLEELNLLTRPDRIYDMDEKGCRLTLHHQQKVVSAKGRKRVHVVAPEHAENVTIVASANAIGNCVPPMIIFKGVNRKPSFGDDLPLLKCHLHPDIVDVADIYEIHENAKIQYNIMTQWLLRNRYV